MNVKAYHMNGWNSTKDREVLVREQGFTETDLQELKAMEIEDKWDEILLLMDDKLYQKAKQTKGNHVALLKRYLAMDHGFETLLWWNLGLEV